MKNLNPPASPQEILQIPTLSTVEKSPLDQLIAEIASSENEIAPDHPFDERWRAPVSSYTEADSSFGAKTLLLSKLL